MIPRVGGLRNLRSSLLFSKVDIKSCRAFYQILAFCLKTLRLDNSGNILWEDNTGRQSTLVRKIVGGP